MAKKFIHKASSLLEGMINDDSKVLVVGPNWDWQDDPTPVFFATRLYKKEGSVFVIDRTPTSSDYCHGNIFSYKESVDELKEKVRMRDISYLISDALHLSCIKDKTFDLIMDRDTLRFIVSYQVNELKKKDFKRIIKKTANAYDRVLKKDGKMIFIKLEKYGVDSYEVDFFDEIYTEMENLLRDKEYNIKKYRLLEDYFFKSKKGKKIFANGEANFAMVATKP